MLDHSNNCSKYQRAHHPPVSLLVETEETEPPSRTKKTDDRGPPSSESDDVRHHSLKGKKAEVKKALSGQEMDSIKRNARKPKGGGRMGVHCATSLYNSSQPKVLLTRINSNMFQSLLNHSNNRSKSARPHHSPLLPHVEEKEIEPRSRVEEVETQEKMINGHGLPSSEEHDDNVHHAISLCNSSQPKVLLTRINSNMFQSLLNHCNNKSKSPKAHYPPVLPHVVEKEIEPPSRMEEVKSQEKMINGHDLPSSEERGDNVYDITKLCNSSQPKVLLTRLNSSISQSLLDHRNNRGDFLKAHPVLSPVEEKDNEPPSRMEKEKTQEKMSCHNLTSSEELDDNVHHTTCHYDTSQPRVVLTRVSKDLLDSLLDLGSPNSNEVLEDHSPSPSVKEMETEQLHESERPKVRLRARKKINYHISSEDDESETERRIAVRKDSSVRDTNFAIESYATSSTETDSTSPEESDSAHELSRPNVASQSNVGLTRRERPLRLAVQKKINYCEFSVEEKEKRRNRNNSESSGSFSSASLKRKTKKRKRKKKGNKVPKVTEHQLRKEAMMGTEKHLSAYEKQRMKNIQQKLAFLKSLKIHDSMNAESSEDD